MLDAGLFHQGGDSNVESNCGLPVASSRVESLLSVMATRSLSADDYEWMRVNGHLSVEVKRRQHELRAREDVQSFYRSGNTKLLISAVNHFTRASKPKDGIDVLMPMYPFDSVEFDVKLRVDLLLAFGRAVRRYFKHESKNLRDYALMLECGELCLRLMPGNQKVLCYLGMTALVGEKFEDATHWFVRANRAGVPMRRVRSDVLGYYSSVDTAVQEKMRKAIRWVGFN
ncbi:hypothetical protein [Vibrio owensii]|uniref:hypothetical protein n=1 Tax=Vibrio owensii TaxID=696485 RepID=UPI0018F1A660|nr:hypothetical protein [Vibrio owensii]